MRPARGRLVRRVAGDAATAVEAAAMAAAVGTVAAKAVRAEAIDVRNHFANYQSRNAIDKWNWAGLDSNQRRREASRFTVCPVWPLRYLPAIASRAQISCLRMRTLIVDVYSKNSTMASNFSKKHRSEEHTSELQSRGHLV